MGKPPAERVIIECEGCARSYLGVLDDGEVRTIAGTGCPGCDTAEFTVVDLE